MPRAANQHPHGAATREASTYIHTYINNESRAVIHKQSLDSTSRAHEIIHCQTLRHRLCMVTEVHRLGYLVRPSASARTRLDSSLASGFAHGEDAAVGNFLLSSFPAWSGRACVDGCAATWIGEMNGGTVLSWSTSVVSRWVCAWPKAAACSGTKGERDSGRPWLSGVSPRAVWC